MTEALLGELRVRFRETTASRLQEMRELLDALERDLADSVALQKLARHFHALAGLGATYGYPRVSELGDEGEGAILPMTRSGATPPAALLARWRELAAGVAAAVAEEMPAMLIPATVRSARSLFDVLIVEDDAELAPLIAHALDDEGLATRVCATREQALAAMALKTPDALIVDILLPDGSGYDVLDALRTQKGCESTGAIVISAPQAFSDKVRALHYGADAFASKPLDLHALVRRVLAFRARKEQPPPRILAVEDDPTQILLLKRVLGDAGYEVAVCSDPGGFEECLLDFCPDLLLMDVHLSDGEMSGYDLVRYVRQSDRFAGLPVIFVTSDSERQAVMESAVSGGDVLVTKPVDWRLLLAQVASRLQRASQQRELVDRDALTGLLTRGAFEMRARQRAAAHAAGSLALLDIDRFKDVNDSFGHLAGDRVLATLGTLLRRRLRPSDAAGRYGGEEFALLLDGVSAGDAATIIDRLLAEFAALEHGTTGKVTFSAGVSSFEDSYDAAFRRADAALYEAKRSGRAKVVSPES
jgi:diguanylate cyclase (GGDEF)-like protein